MAATQTPQLGSILVAETVSDSGAVPQRVTIEVTAVTERECGWSVWGYRHGASSFTKRRPRQTAYPNEYWVAKR